MASPCLMTTWWRHQMEAFPRRWPFLRGIHWSPVNSPHKGQCRGALMFSLIWAWTNGWANNRDAGDLRSHRAHYDDTVMKLLSILTLPIDSQLDPQKCTSMKFQSTCSSFLSRSRICIWKCRLQNASHFDEAPRVLTATHRCPWRPNIVATYFISYRNILLSPQMTYTIMLGICWRHMKGVNLYWRLQIRFVE